MTHPQEGAMTAGGQVRYATTVERAVAWALEAKNPERWGYQVKVAVREHVKAFLDCMERELPRETFEAVVVIADNFFAAGASIGRTDEDQADAA